MNINADWVNMKGGHTPPAAPARSHQSIPIRRLARSPSTRLLWKDRD